MTAHNLPHQATPFVGRSRELTEIATLLSDPACRLLTLLGAGGIGKTRLALQAAAKQLAHFAHGVFFVSLSPVNTPDLIDSAVASALQITFTSQDVRVQLVRYLREKQILLLMDNFEHLLEGVGLLADILEAAPNVKFLVTSRERLNIQEEWVLALDGLRVPNDQSAEPLESYSAVELFVQRARQVQANFSLSDNAEAVKTVCQRVEGMPLGLELAASWLRAMSCRQIAAQMAGSIDFLTTPLRDVPERHRSLRAVFEQSWKLLSETERQVWTYLSVFRGGFDLEAAEQVAGATLPLLAGLMDKSLIRLNAEGRYDLHELLRQYAADRLSTDELNAAMQRHFDYFLMLAEQAETHQFGREQIPWFDRLEVEFDNLRTAFTWSLKNDQSHGGLRLATALGRFFTERSYWIEGLEWLEQALAATLEISASLHAKALHSAGELAWFVGNWEQQRVLLEQALTLARAANDQWNIAWTLSHQGQYVEGESEQGAVLLDESIKLFRTLGDAMGLAHTLIRRTWTAVLAQQYDIARSNLQEGFILARRAGDPIITGWSYFWFAVLSWLQDHDLNQAKAYSESSVAMFRQAQTPTVGNNALVLLAAVEQALGNVSRAQMLNEEALISIRDNTPSDFNVAVILAGLGSAARLHGQFERAARLLSAAKRTDIDFAAVGGYADLLNFDNEVELVRAQLGSLAFNEAWRAGDAMPRDQIIAYALAVEMPPAQPVQPSIASLSARELEVLRLVTEGSSNQEIADRLYIGVSTVKKHINHIYEKLNVKNRTQATAEAQKLAQYLSTGQRLTDSLSARELEVLRLVAEGMTNAEIAQKLFLTVGTVKVHTSNIYGKLGVSSRTQAVAEATRLALI